VFDQPHAASVHAQLDGILAPSRQAAQVADHLVAARTDVLAFAAFLKELGRRR
jgi:putative transposase